MAMVMDLTETGARTAKVHDGAGGWVAHHNTDLWRATAPIDGPPWGMWPMGGAWLCLHLWDHYDSSGDKDYLAKVYPAMKGAAQFFLDTLVEEPKHNWLVTCPSLSPENGHPFGDERLRRARRWTCRSCATCSRNCIRAAEILGVDEDFRKQAGRDTRSAWPRIRSAGRPAAGMAGGLGHEGPGDPSPPRLAPLRPVSRATRFTSRTTPDLAAAARKSRWRFAATTPPAGASAGGSTSGPGCTTASTPMRSSRMLLRPRADLSEHVRRPSAVPDRRQLRRHLRHRRDAAAKPRRRDRAAAGPAQGLAHRLRQGPARRGGFEVDLALERLADFTKQ